MKMVERLKELLKAKGESADIYIHSAEWFRGTFRIRYKYYLGGIQGREQEFTAEEVDMSDEDWQKHLNKFRT